MMGNLNTDKKYEDIINLPHHVSPTRPQMSISDRAAQFSPFAALTGHDAAVKETARLTDERIELDESRKIILNEKLQIIAEHLTERPEIIITYFQPDERKNGGSYVKICGQVKKIDEIEHCVRLMDETKICIEQIYEIEGEVVSEIDFAI